MDLTYPAEAEEFRAEIRSWLEANLPADWGQREMTGEEKAEFSKAWNEKLFEGGWICASWPKEYGGKGLSTIQNVVLNEEFARVGAPMRGDFFGDLMNAPAKYVVSRTLANPIWRNTTVIRDDVIGAIKVLKAKPGKDILTDGSSQLVRAMLQHDLVDELHLLVYPVVLGGGKRIFPDGVHAGFTLRSATPYPTGVVGLDYVRTR